MSRTGVRAMGFALLLTAVVCVALFATGGGAEAAKDRRGVTIATIPPERTAFAKTIPITRKPNKKLRSIASLKLKQLGPLKSGKTLEGSAEASVSVCLKPNRNHGGSRKSCIGKTYGYNPKVTARVVVAGGKKKTRGRKAVQVGRTSTRLCTQDQPDRNHHCVITVNWQSIATEDLKPLGCLPNKCVMNVVLGAFHGKAEGNHNIVVGGVEGSNGKVDNKGVAKVNAVLFNPGDFPRVKPKVDSKPKRRKLNVLDEGRKVNPHVVYSVKIKRPRAGEKLKIEGRYAASTAGNRGPVRTRTQIILADGPGSTSFKKKVAPKVAEESTRIGEDNNFNCTRGSSGHKSPCPIIKPGVISFRNGSKKPVYVNLIAGHGALNHEQWNRSDTVTVKGGYLRVWRYR